MQGVITVKPKGIISDKLINILIAVFAIAMSLYHLISTQYLLQSPMELQNTHFFFSLILVYLLTLKNKKRLWPLVLVLLALTVFSLGYVQVFFVDLQNRAGLPNSLDITVGFILVAISIGGVWLSFGKIIPVVTAVLLIYIFFGHYFPEPLWHPAISLGRMVTQLSIGFNGIYGTALGVSAKYVFLFVLLGALLQASGAARFVMEIGRVAGNKLASGPAMMAVVSSAMVGMISGSAMANVSITGSITIPLMKKTGYAPHQAAAIEATSSTGGALVPPVLGAVAFIMADFLGLPYIQICIMSIIPAILYYLSVALYVQLNAKKIGINVHSQKIDYKLLLTESPSCLATLGLLTYLLSIGYSPMYSAFWAIVASSIISLIVKKEARTSWRPWLKGIMDGAVGEARIGATCGAVGIMAACVTMTGIALKFTAGLEGWAGGSLIIMLILVALMTLMAGCAVPSVVAYMLIVVLTAPVLVKAGVPLAHAHFFVLFYSVFAPLTPPVASAALIAAGIADSPYIKTSIEATKIAIVSFILPVLVIFLPIILMQPSGPLVVQLLGVLALLVSIFSTQAAFIGYFFRTCVTIERAILFVTAALMIIYILTTNFILLGLGLAMFIAVVVSQWKKLKVTRTAVSTGA